MTITKNSHGKNLMANSNGISVVKIALVNNYIVFEDLHIYLATYMIMTS